MCGFVGRIRPGPAANDLEAARPWVARRGPDSQRVWRSADDLVELLHGRLAIVDRDPRANQPLVHRPTGVTLAMNGEIYNYRERRAQLTGFRFETDSDTEVALAVYVTEGIAGLRSLKGMYALAIVDERRRRVILARDPVGKKPLFLARWGGETLFGSSLLALVAAHGTAAPVAADATSHYWEEAFIPPASSALAGARPVLPGRALTLDWRGTVVADDDCEPPPALVYAGEPAAEASANVGTLIRTAVARRLESNPRPMTLLSGGIDSTVVTATAWSLLEERRGGEGLRALTLGAVVPGMNDERYARYAARRIGVPLTVMRPRQRGLAATIARALDLQDEPLGMASFFLLERLVTAAAQHGRILLSGDGGDEVFLGYRPPAEWQSASGASPVAQPRVGGSLPEWFGGWARKVSTGTLLGHMLAKADRASAEQGIELRCPLLDWDVIRYARSLPCAILAGNGTTKALLKGQLTGWPAWYVERSKRGFTYNLRWVWGARRYSGLRDLVDRRAVSTFEDRLPRDLSGDPATWRSSHIFRHFGAVWRLLAWSRFLQRLDSASRSRADDGAVRLSA